MHIDVEMSNTARPQMGRCIIIKIASVAVVAEQVVVAEEVAAFLKRWSRFTLIYFNIKASSLISHFRAALHSQLPA